MSEEAKRTPPPSYEEALRANDCFANASAPFLPSPEHAFQQSNAPVTPLPSQPVPPVPMVVVQQPATVYVPPPLGPKPVTLICPVCHKQVRTTITSTHAGVAHAFCIIMCLIGCWCCSCLPYCLSSTKITKHECPSCKSYLGTFKP